MNRALFVIGVLFSTNLCYVVPARTPSPENVWPLGNSSLYNDVMGTHNMQHNESTVCHIFVDGPSALPYSVLDVKHQPESCFEVVLKDKGTFRDMTISFYVYPDNDDADITGTLLHYQADDREIMRVRMLANTFLVSFRDEYGMSAGMMYLVNFLTAHAWNHLVISRHYPTGTIIVYKDGVEMYNMDDEFSDVISFPRDGKMQIGKSHDPDDADAFAGNFACLQLYTDIVAEDKLASIPKFCLSPQWNHQYNYYYKKRNGQQCLMDPPDSTIDHSIVTITTLTRHSSWSVFLDGNALQSSGKEAGYLKFVSGDQEPRVSTNLIGSFNATSSKVCARLCMRIKGCVAAWTENVGPGCSLYDAEPLTFDSRPGSKFYKLVM